MKNFCVFFAAGCIAFAASAEVLTAEIYEMNSDRKKKLFSMRTVIEKDSQGIETRVGEFKDLEGRVVLKEVAKVKGAEFLESRIEQLQLNKIVSMKVKNGNELEFQITENGNEQKPVTDRAKRKLVLIPAFQNFILENWPQLLKGEKVEFDLGVWQRQEILPFRIQKTGQENDRVFLTMEINNRLLRFLLPTAIQFVMDENGVLLEQKGRVQPMIRDGKKFKDLDAEAIYSVSR